MSSTNKEEYRNLTQEEIKTLTKQGNYCENWNMVEVKEQFNPLAVRNSTFSGNVRIGEFSIAVLEADSLKLAVGIYNSMIFSSDIGDNCALYNVKYLSDAKINQNVIIFNVDEISVSANPLFGNGYEKADGSRNWITVINESGSRKILPFSSIETGDCHLWAKFRGDVKLQSQFINFTDKMNRAPNMGNSKKKSEIGAYSVLRSCRIIRDTNIGEYSRIAGISHLDNITINSSKSSPTFVSEDADLKNGIVGYGAEISHGSRARDFILADHSTLKYGANFFSSFLGENSTVSCCEVNSSMVLPFHEQHHNNSFLIASLLQGQSNIGAGSTVGSNHNSRSADGEISAGRGFWTALSSSTKHNCYFASFTILAKNDFLHEMKIPTPFSLISLNHHSNYLQIMPAYWFRYNMYALTRNSMKFKNRDRRKDKSIIIETDYLAPDTIEEIFLGIDLIEEWALKAGKDLRNLDSEDVIEVEPGILEYSSNPVRILRPGKALTAYREMVLYYAVRTLILYASENNLKLDILNSRFQDEKRMNWTNIGGQLVRENDFNRLVGDIGDNKINSWESLHKEYRNLSSRYREMKAAHAYASLKDILGINKITGKEWNRVLTDTRNINSEINRNIHQSRMKDHTNIFRHITFMSPEEGKAILGNIEDNSFLKSASKNTAAFEKLINKYLDQ